MASQARAKKERVVEAVRQSLEGDSAVEFIRQSGYAMTVSGIARHLRSMGGRGRIQALIGEGKSNEEVLSVCLPEKDASDVRAEPGVQADLHPDVADEPTVPFQPLDKPLYETVRMSIKMPSDLHEAIRLAARGEGRSQNQLIVEILTEALARMPGPIERATDNNL